MIEPKDWIARIVAVTTFVTLSTACAARAPQASTPPGPALDGQAAAPPATRTPSREAAEPGAEGLSLTSTCDAIKSSDATATYLYVRACEKDDGDGCVKAAAAHACGAGVDKDAARALGYLERGCKLKSQEACVSLGVVLATGYLGARDAVRGRALLTASCDAGSAQGCEALGTLLVVGSDDDKARALNALEKACETSASACAMLGGAYVMGVGTKVDHAKGLALSQRACSRDSGLGCNQVGLIYAHGFGVAQDDARAVKWLERSCALGYASGCANLGVLVYTGRGTPRDPQRATALFERACNAGNGEACTALGDIRRVEAAPKAATRRGWDGAI
jgi:hypothetical protein